MGSFAPAAELRSTDGPAADADVAISEKSVMGRGLIVIEALSRAGHPVSLADLARITNLPKSTVHRLAVKLADLGLLDRNEAGFSLGLRIFEWGNRAEKQRRLRRAAVPYLIDLHARLRETVHMAVLDGQDVVYVDKIEGIKALRCPTQIGDRTSAHASALGKAMLAFSSLETRQATLSKPLAVFTSRTITAPGILDRQLQRIRETRISIETEESFLGVACLASPLLDASGTVLGAISVATPTFRFDPNRFAPQVLKAARDIQERLEQTSPTFPF